MSNGFTMKKYLQTSILVMACTLPVSIYTAGPICATENTKAQENLEKLVKTKSCKGCDLSGLTLNRLDLADADLEGADLSSAKISLTNLTRANLRNTNLRGAMFGGTDLSDADLQGADLRGASLDSSYHQGARVDGKFIDAKSNEEAGDTEVKKEVFIADPVKPKPKPETREVKVGERRDFIEPAPVAAVSEAKPEVVPEKPQKVEKESQTSASLSSAPTEKKVALVQQAIVDVPVQDEKIAVVPVTAPVTVKEEVKKQAAVEPVTATPEKMPKESVSEQKTKSAATVSAPQTATKAQQNPVAGKSKEDNLQVLLDKKKCFGCDLSGLDLAGKNLDSADLEKANLTGCNLEKADLENANLKGALLLNANLRRASLKNADLYKADLTGADLTEAKIEGAMFDSAQTASAKGFKEAIGDAAK